MNILIIGGAGFIGSHLCESYADNHNVTSIDNYISGKKENHINKVEYIEMDAKDILSIDKKFDLIFIDGGHDLETAESDLLNCKNLSHNDTIVIMDDTVYEKTMELEWNLGPTNAWLKAIEKKLINSEFSENTFSRAANLIDKDFSPLDDMRASRNYRLTVAKNLLLKAFYEIKDKKNIRIHS